MDKYEELYESMCADCERSSYCHENCEECEEFQEALEEMEAEIDEAIDDTLKDMKEENVYPAHCDGCKHFQECCEKQMISDPCQNQDAIDEENEAACEALKEVIEKNKEEARNSKPYQKMMRFHKKNLKEILKQSGPWEWSWITDYIGEYLKWIRDYYKLGINVVGMEIKDTEEFNDPTHPTRLEIAQKLVDAWEEAFGENAEFKNEAITAKIFFDLLGENIGELWD